MFGHCLFLPEISEYLQYFLGHESPPQAQPRVNTRDPVMSCRNKHVQRTHWTPRKSASTFSENSRSDFESGGFMKLERSLKRRTIDHRSHVRLAPIALLLLVPLAAHAQGT